MQGLGSVFTRLSFCWYCIAVRLRQLSHVLRDPGITVDASLDGAKSEQLDRVRLLETGRRIASSLKLTFDELRVSDSSYQAFHLSSMANDLVHALDNCLSLRLDFDTNYNYVLAQFTKVSNGVEELKQRMSEPESSWSSVGALIVQDRISTDNDGSRLTAYLQQCGLSLDVLLPKQISPEHWRANSIIFPLHEQWRRLEVGIDNLRLNDALWLGRPTVASNPMHSAPQVGGIQPSESPTLLPPRHDEDKAGWYHTPDEPIPPKYNPTFVLEETKINLSDALEEPRKGKTKQCRKPRVIEQKAKSGRIWVVKLEGQRWRVYFVEQKYYEDSKRRLETT